MGRYTIHTTDLLECPEVCVFKIPPGNLSISQWSKLETSSIWTGALKLVEQHLQDEDDDDGDGSFDGINDDLPTNRMRLKLELFNKVDSQSIPWATVWYNPPADLNDNFQIETIQKTQSIRLFKIIAQIPETEYFEKNDQLQVALGLKFHDKIDAYTFIERLQTYQRIFNSYTEQLKFETEMSQITSQQEQLKIDDDNDDNEDFGDFIG